MNDDTIDALKRGRITTWHAERVTADQLRTYLEAAEWAEAMEQWYLAPTIDGYRCTGGPFIRSSSRHPQEGIPVAPDGQGEVSARYHYEAIQSIAAIEGRGDLSVWLDVRQIDEEAT